MKSWEQALQHVGGAAMMVGASFGVMGMAVGTAVEIGIGGLIRLKEQLTRVEEAAARMTGRIAAAPGRPGAAIAEAYRDMIRRAGEEIGRGTGGFADIGRQYTSGELGMSALNMATGGLGGIIAPGAFGYANRGAAALGAVNTLTFGAAARIAPGTFGPQATAAPGTALTPSQRLDQAIDRMLEEQARASMMTDTLRGPLAPHGTDRRRQQERLRDIAAGAVQMEVTETKEKLEMENRLAGLGREEMERERYRLQLADLGRTATQQEQGLREYDVQLSIKRTNDEEIRIRNLGREVELLGHGKTEQALIRAAQEARDRYGANAVISERERATIIQTQRAMALNAVEEENRGLEERTARIGMSANAAERYTTIQRYAHDRGIGILQAEREITQELERQVSLRSRLNLVQQVQQRLEGLAAQAWVAGLPPEMRTFESMVFERARTSRGEFNPFETWAEALARARQELTPIRDDLETIERRIDAAKLFEETATPLERMGEHLHRIDNLLIHGDISWDTYNRSVTRAAHSILGAGRASQRWEAAEYGSMEWMSRQIDFFNALADISPANMDVARAAYEGRRMGPETRQFQGGPPGTAEGRLVGALDNLRFTIDNWRVQIEADAMSPWTRSRARGVEVNPFVIPPGGLGAAAPG
jgi:hypothetical protein